MLTPCVMCACARAHTYMLKPQNVPISLRYKSKVADSPMFTVIVDWKCEILNAIQTLYFSLLCVCVERTLFLSCCFWCSLCSPHQLASQPFRPPLAHCQRDTHTLFSFFSPIFLFSWVKSRWNWFIFVWDFASIHCNIKSYGIRSYVSLARSLIPFIGLL